MSVSRDSRKFHPSRGWKINTVAISISQSFLYVFLLFFSRRQPFWTFHCELSKSHLAFQLKSQTPNSYFLSAAIRTPANMANFKPEWKCFYSFIPFDVVPSNSTVRGEMSNWGEWLAQVWSLSHTPWYEWGNLDWRGDNSAIFKRGKW